MFDVGYELGHVFQPGERQSARASVLAGIGTAAVGILVLCGWTWDIESFKTVYGPITMKSNTAMGLLLCGTSLALLRWSPRTSVALATLAGLIGGLTLSEHVFGWDVGIDQLLFTEAPGAAATSSPNRMGLNACTTFLLVASSLLLLVRAEARSAAVAQGLAVLGLVLAAIPIAGYLYGAEQLYGIAQYTGIALHTALAFSLLEVGLLLARAELGPVAIFFSVGPAGTLTRRIALPMVAIPLLLGYLEIYARNLEVVDRGMGIALYAISLIVVLGIMMWQTAQVIERSDRARRSAESERDLLIVKEQQARAEAERSNHLKDNFIATLSHELRTPLNVMLGWTRILEHENADPAEHPRIAGLVAKNGRLLARLVEDLLDISRATTGHFDISRTTVALNAVVQSSLEAITPTAGEKSVAVVAELDPMVEPIDADGQRVQQIVWNLLSNAVKFTDPGGQIVVRTWQDREAVMLAVSDTGVGFSEAFASDLFKPFRQADSSARREYGGLGLGLSIARHLAELHGGSLTGASPGTGRGATFTLTLPRWNAMQLRQAPTPLEARPVITLDGEAAVN